MKTFLLILLLTLSLSCARRDVTPPLVIDFSSLTFTGAYRLSGAVMPVQGALKHERGTLKIALMAQHGVLLGYGTLDPLRGKTRVLFARVPSARALVEDAGADIAAILPFLPLRHKGQESLSRIDFPPNWEYQQKRVLFLYRDAEKTLSIPLERIR